MNHPRRLLLLVAAPLAAVAIAAPGRTFLPTLLPTVPPSIPPATPSTMLSWPAVAEASGDHHDHGASDHDGDHGDPHDDHHDEAPTGPNGGRLVGDGDLVVELLIFETGVVPQLRAWAWDHGSAVDPSGVELSVTLHRLGAAPEKLSFRAVDDFLLGDRVVAEPHSFAVDVEASAGGHRMHARFESHEARVEMSSAKAEAGGVSDVVAGPRDLARSRRLTGRVGVPNDRLAEVRPRFAGVVREARGRTGDRVEAGEVLAVVENSATLARYTLAAPMDGVLLDRRAVSGAAVDTGDPLYVVADLSEVWADFDVYGEDTDVVTTGEKVVVRDGRGRREVEAVVSYVSPLRDVHTQTMLARAVLDNRDGGWAPGAFVTGTITLKEEPAAVAVPASALQTWKGRDAVFLRVGDVWEARPVRVGRRGEQWLEILDGIAAGSRVATGNTFLLRAEIEKAGATHAH